jgi:hypothetical protein
MSIVPGSLRYNSFGTELVQKNVAWGGLKEVFKIDQSILYVVDLLSLGLP